MRLVLGGSFDPVHEGHAHLIRKLLEINQPEKIILVPAKQNPLKDASGAPAAARLEMLRLSLGEIADKRVTIADLELNREGDSYTVDTLAELRRAENGDVTFVLGNEIFPDLPRWKDPVGLLSSTNLIVVARERSAFTPYSILAALGMFAVKQEKNRWHHSGKKWIELQEVEALPISSTKLREDISRHVTAGTDTFMPQGIQRSVWRYIKENHLYAVK